MYQVTHTSAEEFGPRSEKTVLGVFSTRELAQQCAADSGLKCRVSAYKLTPTEAKRAAMLASFGRAYVPATVERNGGWSK